MTRFELARIPSAAAISRYLPVVLVVILGALVLLVAAAEEPYHIDELRQVRSYGRDLPGVVTASIQQEQPPLDSVLNSISQRALGIGDVRQRALSVLFGVASLALVPALGLKSGFSILGAVTSVGVMAFTPTLIRVTAYARPYALPLFLMLAFLMLTHAWLERGRAHALLSAAVVALLLPWSRTVEPVIFLTVSALVMSLVARSAELRRRALSMLAVCGMGLASSVPSLSVLSDELSDRTASTSSLLDRLSRLWTDVPQTIGASIEYWPVLLPILALAIALPVVRRTLYKLWWWWILVGTALGFSIAFVLVAPISQPFFGRYLFTWVPALAVLLGAVVSALVTDREQFPSQRVLAIAVAGVLLAWGALLTWHDLSTRSTSDWKAVSRVITDDLPEEIAIVYDQLRPLGSYRTPYAGFPRYTEGHPRIPLSLSLISNPSALIPGRSTAVVLLSGGDRVRVPGWVGIGVDTYFTVYLPESPRPGLKGAAKAAEEFGAAVQPRIGAALMLAAASLWLEAGEEERATRIVQKVMDEPEIHTAAKALMQGTDLEGLSESR